MDRDQHRLLPNSPCYLSLFLECPLLLFTITLCLFLARFIEQGRRKRGRRECKETVYYKEDKKRKTSHYDHHNPSRQEPSDAQVSPFSVMLHLCDHGSSFHCAGLLILSRMLHCSLTASGF